MRLEQSVSWKLGRSTGVGEFARDGEGVEFAVADFADAFLTMPLLEHERKYVVGRRKTHTRSVLTVGSSTAVLRGSPWSFESRTFKT